MSALHPKLQEKLENVILSCQSTMCHHFAVRMSFDELQELLIPDEDKRKMFQYVGTLSKPTSMYYEYKIGSKLTINIYCHTGEKMPAVLLPAEVAIGSQEFLDIIRPLYLMTKAWRDLYLSFNAVCNIVTLTKELNFYAPWLRYLFPNEKFTNVSNGAFHISHWITGSVHDKSLPHGTISIIHRQVNEILNNEHTDRRTWMPVELVQMVRTGDELITQYNLIKNNLKPWSLGMVPNGADITVDISTTDHPVVKWETEAREHRRKVLDEQMQIADERAKIRRQMKEAQFDD